MKKPALLVTLVMAALLFSLAPAQADTYYFFPIAQGVPSSYYSTTSNLYMEVTEDISDNSATATFVFHNALSGSLVDGKPSGAYGEITEIYFYDGGLLGAVMSITNNNDVIFEQPEIEVKLPGAQEVGIPAKATATFTATDVPGGGTPGYGINPGEQLTITFALNEERTIGVIDSLNAWTNAWTENAPNFKSGSMLAVGLHLQKMPQFLSENNNYATSSGFVVAYGSGAGGLVPLPPSVFLLGSGLLGLAALGWRRRRD